MLLAFLEDTNIISGFILLTIMLLHDKNCKRAHARAIRRWRNETCDENRVQELFKDQLRQLVGACYRTKIFVVFLRRFFEFSMSGKRENFGMRSKNCGKNGGKLRVFFLLFRPQFLPRKFRFRGRKKMNFRARIEKLEKQCKFFSVFPEAGIRIGIFSNFLFVFSYLAAIVFSFWTV